MAAASGACIVLPSPSTSRTLFTQQVSTCVAMVTTLERISSNFSTYGGSRRRCRSLRWKQQRRVCSEGGPMERSIKTTTVVARLFHPEDFDASKLTVRYESDAYAAQAKSIEDLLPRKYTLTHSDVTGELLLSIGPSFNELQLAGWYTRLMRDEIIAEWRVNGKISLHVHCHVSGGHILLAPAALRNNIFEREMPLVLEAIRSGDREFLAQYPELDASTVWVHFHSSNPEYNRADCWGPLYYAANSMRRVLGGADLLKMSEPVTSYALVEVERELVELCT